MAMTNAERQAAWRERMKAKLAALQAQPATKPKAMAKPKKLDRKVQPVINVGAAPGRSSISTLASDRLTGRDAEIVRVIAWLQTVRGVDFTNWQKMRGPLTEEIARLDKETRLLRNDSQAAAKRSRKP